MMWMWVLGSAIVLANGVLSQDSENGPGPLNCSAAESVMNSVRQCRVGFEDFMSKDLGANFQGSAIRGAMESVCRNRESTSKCIQRVGETCSQYNQLLKNSSAIIYSRLCNGNTLQPWYLQAMPADLNVDRPCVYAFMGASVGACMDTIGQLPSDPNRMNLQEQVDYGTILTSRVLGCLSQNLTNINLGEMYSQCDSGVRAQDVFMLFYSMVAGNPLEIRNIPSEETFESIKAIVAPSSNLRRALWELLGFKGSR